MSDVSAVRVWWFCLAALLLCAGNARAGDDEVVAAVGGEAVTRRALEERIREIHINKPRMRAEESESVDVRAIVRELVDDRLLAQEAVRMELDRESSFRGRFDAYVTAQSVLRLRREEVIDQVEVSEDDILAFFKERFGVDEEEVDEAQLARHRRKIDKVLRKRRERQLAGDFVAGLKAKADIDVHRERMVLDPPREETEAVATVNGVAITWKDYARDMGQAVDAQSGDAAASEVGERVLDQLVVYELVRQEAARRGYDKDRAFAERLRRGRERLLIESFKRVVIAPQAQSSEEDLRAYYKEHAEDFLTGGEVRFSGMRFNEREGAEQALREWEQGAGFSYLRKHLADGVVARGDGSWVPLAQIPAAQGEALRALAVGGVSQILSDGRGFVLLMLKERRGGTPVPFERVSRHIATLLGRQKFSAALEQYTQALRRTAKITIDAACIAEIESQCWTRPAEKAATGE